MVQGISFERFVVYIIFFITIFFVCISAGYLAQADQEGRNIRLVVQSTVPEAVVSHQPFGVWFHTGSDPLLGPFEESLDLMSIRTFRSEIHAPLFAEEPIIIRGFWRQE